MNRLQTLYRTDEVQASYVVILQPNHSTDANRLFSAWEESKDWLESSSDSLDMGFLMGS